MEFEEDFFGFDPFADNQIPPNQFNPPPITDTLSQPQTPQEHVGNTKKQKWTPEEDEQLLESVKKHGTSNWPLIASALTGRTGKQCRERWLNQLKPDLLRDNWTTQEDHILVQQQRIFGNSWSKIAVMLPGRSANAIKNRWSWLNRHKNRNQRNLASMPQPGMYPPAYYPPMVAPGTFNYMPNPIGWFSRPGFDPRALSDPRYLSDPNVINSFSQGGSATDLSLPQTPQDVLPTTPLVTPTTTPTQNPPQPDPENIFEANLDLDSNEAPFW